MDDARRPLRLGLIGAGRWGRVLIRVIRETPGLDLCWLASRAPDARDLVRPGATVVQDGRALREATAGAEPLDGVVIATPANAHAEPLRAAIEAHLPAFVEKPLATTLADAESLAELQRASRVPVLVDHTAIFHPGYARLRDLVAQSRVRNVVSTGGQWGRRGGDVGALWDYGPHDLALCLDLLGTNAQLEGAEIAEQGPIDDQRCEVVRLHLSWPGGAVATATFGNHMPTRRRWFAVDDGHQVMVLDGTTAPHLRRLPAAAGLQPGDRVLGEPIPIDNTQPLDRAFARFAALIRQPAQNTGHPAEGLDLGVAVVRMLAEAASRLGI